MGFYFQGQKVGHTHFRLAREKEAPVRYRIAEEAHMEMQNLGTSQSVDILLEAELDETLRPLSVRFEMKTPAATIHMTGVAEGDEMKFTLVTPESRETRTYRRDEVDFIGDDPTLRATLRPLAVGDTIQGFTVVPFTLDRVPYSITVTGQETVKVGSQAETALVLSSEMMGNRTKSWILPDGTPLRIEGPAGIVFLREPEAVARAGGSQSTVDLAMALSIVSTGRDLPARPRRAVYRVRGLPADWAGLTGGTQRKMEGEGPGVRVEVDLGLKEGHATEADLAATTAVNTNDPRVLAAAREAAGGARGEEAARKIGAWVHRNLRKEISFTLPTASDVLVSRAGDCNEHTVLYVAMARALGIPSRIACGVVSLDGRFLYHAWPEVYLDGKGWIPADPTFGEFPASAGRIRLATGEITEQARILGLAGQLEIEVEEAE